MYVTCLHRGGGASRRSPPTRLVQAQELAASPRPRLSGPLLPLHPCQLINRLSGQVSDIEHLIRTLSDQSLTHLVASSPPMPPPCSSKLRSRRAGEWGRPQPVPSQHPAIEISRAGTEVKVTLASPFRTQPTQSLSLQQHFCPPWLIIPLP